MDNSTSISATAAQSFENAFYRAQRTLPPDECQLVSVRFREILGEDVELTPNGVKAHVDQLLSTLSADPVRKALAIIEQIPQVEDFITETVDRLHLRELEKTPEYKLAKRIVEICSSFISEIEVVTAPRYQMGVGCDESSAEYDDRRKYNADEDARFTQEQAAQEILQLKAEAKLTGVLSNSLLAQACEFEILKDRIVSLTDYQREFAEKMAKMISEENGVNIEPFLKLVNSRSS